MPEGCCPPFDPEAWQAKTLTWEKKRFVKDKVFCLFFMPVGFGKTMRRVMGRLEAAKAACPDGLCLSEHTSRWNMDVYVSVDKDVPGAEVRELDGKFVCRVYEGPFRDTGKWCKDFAEKAAADKLTVDKQYMWYTTCPKCAKERGKNYVAILGHLAS